jgi:hypothetical protein
MSEGARTARRSTHSRLTGPKVSSSQLFITLENDAERGPARFDEGREPVLRRGGQGTPPGLYVGSGDEVNDLKRPREILRHVEVGDGALAVGRVEGDLLAPPLGPLRDLDDLRVERRRLVAVGLAPASKIRLARRGVGGDFPLQFEPVK